MEAQSPQLYTAAYLGNGAIGLATTALGTTPARSLLAGVYDETPGDTPRIASAPAWNEVDVLHEGGWLNSQPPSSLENYRQVLDMYGGVLRTAFVWVPAGKRLRYVSSNSSHAIAPMRPPCRLRYCLPSPGSSNSKS